MDAETFAAATAVVDAFDYSEITHSEMILGVSAVTGFDENAVLYFANQLAMIRYNRRQDAFFGF